MPDLRIYFAGDVANLYDVGYLSTDLFQLIAFAELIDQEKDDEIDRWFGEKARPFNRYASVMDKFRRAADIRAAKGGSLELTVATASLVSSVVVPLVAIYIERHLAAKHPATMTFEVSAQDARVQQLLNMFSRGHFGSGPQGIERLFEELRARGYNVSVRSSDVYAIHDTLDRYSQRMVRTLNRP